MKLTWLNQLKPPTWLKIIFTVVKDVFQKGSLDSTNQANTLYSEWSRSALSKMEDKSQTYCLQPRSRRELPTNPPTHECKSDNDKKEQIKELLPHLPGSLAVVS